MMCGRRETPASDLGIFWWLMIMGTSTSRIGKETPSGIIIREGGDIGFFITLVAKVL